MLKRADRRLAPWLLSAVLAATSGCPCNDTDCALDDVDAVPAHSIETGIAGASIAQSDVPDDFGCVVCSENQTTLTIFTVETAPTTADEFRILFQRSDVPRDEVNIEGSYEHALDPGAYAICAGDIVEFAVVGCANVDVAAGAVRTLHAAQGNTLRGDALVGTPVNVEDL